MVRTFIGIGSNVGQRQANIDLAVSQLQDLEGVEYRTISPVYETEPVGPVDQGMFLNAVAEVETHLPPDQLLESLLAIEALAGRAPADHRQKWGPRILDLDILLYGDLVASLELGGDGGRNPGSDLEIPHPRMHERWFVLKPLADLDDQLVHPVLKLTIAQLLQQLDS